MSCMRSRGVLGVAGVGSSSAICKHKKAHQVKANHCTSVLSQLLPYLQH